MIQDEKTVTELAPSRAAAGTAAQEPTATSLTSLVEHLTTRIEALLTSVHERPAQDARLLAQFDALRHEQSALASGLADLQRRIAAITGPEETAWGIEAKVGALQRRIDEVASSHAPAPRSDQILEKLQQRVDELARQDSAIGQAVQALTERVRLLAQAGPSEIVSPSQLITSGTTAAASDEPFIVTIGSIRGEGELRRLLEAIQHLPSVAAVEASPLEAGSVRFTVRLLETWPRSSFTRQISWLEGLRLSLIFTGPDGLRADLLSSEGSPHKQEPSRLRRLFHRSAPRPSGAAAGARQ